MDRRHFLRAAGAGSVSLALPGAVSKALANTTGNPWRVYEVTTRVEVLKPVGVTRVWVPLPLSADTDYQKALGSSWDAGAGKAAPWKDAKYGAGAVAAEWAADTKPVLEVKSRFATCDRAVDLSAKPGNQRLDEASRRLYTGPTDLIPTDGIVRATAMKAVKGASGDVERGRAVYEWIVDNTFRDPKVKGCGIGDITTMLETGYLGGKCADLNALYVGLARAAGLPARDVYGVRVANSAEFKSLGRADDITGAQHCRAEVYLNGYGWVPVDPADVRKVVLEENLPGEQLPIDDPKVKKARAKLFGAWEMNWLPYNYSHDVKLPQSRGAEIAYLMYPQGETANGRKDSLDSKSFTYSIKSKEI